MAVEVPVEENVTRLHSGLRIRPQTTVIQLLTTRHALHQRVM
ncbi:hypothetical protein A1Q_3830 [Vibrio campbellii HY01]|nr:hypothetical protein A1Q_3830 [Vibrio campbellii HY01]